MAAVLDPKEEKGHGQSGDPEKICRTGRKKSRRAVRGKSTQRAIVTPVNRPEQLAGLLDFSVGT